MMISIQLLISVYYRTKYIQIPIFLTFQKKILQYHKRRKEKCGKPSENARNF